jgi:hypothetical protein
LIILVIDGIEHLTPPPGSARTRMSLLRSSAGVPVSPVSSQGGELAFESDATATILAMGRACGWGREFEEVDRCNAGQVRR